MEAKVESEAVPILIPWQTLKAYETDLLEKAGVPRPDAERVAETLVNSDLRGVYSHGIQNLGNYLTRLRAGLIDGKARMEVVRETPSAALIDAKNGVGQLAGLMGMELCIKKAKGAGIATVAVGHSNHYGAAAYYAIMAAKEGLIGYSTTNAGCTLAPFGGLTKSLGNDPLCWAIPSGGKYPVVLDMATTVVAAGKLNIAANKGEDIPFGWAIDSEGDPTHDARALAHGGSLVPVAGPKGYGLSVIAEILCGVMSYSSFGTLLSGERRGQNVPLDIGHFFIALDPSVLMPPDEFKQRVDTLAQQMKSSRLAKGVSKIYMPGEPEWEKYETNMANGVPVLPKVWENSAKIAAELGVKVPSVG
ncbi:MAG: Ldh family oxidoreductase [Bacteroidetes bacterium]|nr:Ldh family oxidoreductase [Bacteroidota bacterium]MCL5024992.1 Ldh family oxidoreductase [Chloroflexota bacterium]